MRNINKGFTLKGYEEILNMALDQGYSFLSYSDVGTEGEGLICILRHDVDSELLGCGPMIDIEESLGIQSTYFLMPRSTAYNLFSYEGSEMVRKIVGAGHSVGLHFMGEMHLGDNPDVVVKSIEREVEMLQTEFSVKISAVSLHQPDPAILDAQLAIPGIINTYNQSQLPGYQYVSDTNMTWRYGHPLEFFQEKRFPRLQLLVHPMWWTVENVQVEEKWRIVLMENRQALLEHWYKRERSLNGIEL